jgi:hypothetical protein
MATSKLAVWNGCLRLCRERKLSSLTENREPRRLLDDAWGDGSTTGAVKACLEMGQWTFATRSAQIEYTPSIEPDFGYRRAFDQPSDMVRPVGICSDEYFNSPLLQYADERRYWYADLDTIYVRYVSNDSEYGADLSLWSEVFAKLVEAYLAREIVGSLTGGDSERVEKSFGMAKKEAQSLDAMNNPTKFLPMGSWSRARFGGWGGDRGSRSNLIG